MLLLAGETGAELTMVLEPPAATRDALTPGTAGMPRLFETERSDRNRDVEEVPPALVTLGVPARDGTIIPPPSPFETEVEGRKSCKVCAVAAGDG